MKVVLRGGLPQSVRRSLEQAGLVPADSGEVVIVWYDGRVLREDSVDPADLSQLSPRDEPVVAITAEPALQEQAFRAGATLVWSSLPPTVEILSQVRGLALYADRWRQRTRAAQRAAQRSSDAQHEARALLQGLLQATPDPVVVADLRGRILQLNEAAQHALGYSEAEARGHLHVSDLYADPGDARRVMAEIRAQGGVAQVGRVRLRSRSGLHIPVRLRAGELCDPHGVPVATYGVLEDLSEEIALSLRLDDATNRLIATEQRLVTLARVGATAHELNQPLTAAMGTLELLEMRGDLPEDARGRLQRAYSQLERLASLVSELATATRRSAIDYDGDKVSTVHQPSSSPPPRSRT